MNFADMNQTIGDRGHFSISHFSSDQSRQTVGLAVLSAVKYQIEEQ
jgi:hypothetical protein